MLSLLGKLSLRELKLNPAGSLKMDLKVDRNYVLKFILDAVSLVVCKCAGRHALYWHSPIILPWPKPITVAGNYGKLI